VFNVCIGRGKGGNRVGIDDTKTRESGRKTLSSCRTAPLKAKSGLSGPPVGVPYQGSRDGVSISW
jgi:hypothetical protein